LTLELLNGPWWSLLTKYQLQCIEKRKGMKCSLFSSQALYSVYLLCKIPQGGMATSGWKKHRICLLLGHRLDGSLRDSGVIRICPGERMLRALITDPRKLVDINTFFADITHIAIGAAYS